MGAFQACTKTSQRPENLGSWFEKIEMKLGVEGSDAVGADGQENMKQSADEASKEHGQQNWNTSQKLGW